MQICTRGILGILINNQLQITFRRILMGNTCQSFVENKNTTIINDPNPQPAEFTQGQATPSFNKQNKQPVSQQATKVSKKISDDLNYSSSNSEISANKLKNETLKTLKNSIVTTKSKGPSTKVFRNSVQQNVKNSLIFQPHLYRTFSFEQNFQKEEIKFNRQNFFKLKKKNFAEDYQIIEKIGKGGFGVVFKVRMRKTGIVRAMKSIKKSAICKEDEQKIFSQMSILKQLDHPNIIKLFQVYDFCNHYYLITEFYEGGQLFQQIKINRHFSEKHASQILKEIVDPLIYLHNKNIVHRDLKPQNLMYALKGGQGTLKIIDFGLSTTLKKNQKLTRRTGTFLYMAPEVFHGQYDTKCDIWSLGVMLYIFLSGYPPFRGKNERQIIHNIRHGPLLFQKNKWYNISSQAIQLIRKMLNKNPVQRISASQILESDWVQGSCPNQPLDKQTLSNLKNFHVQNKLKGIVMTYIASHLFSTKEKARLEKIFKQLDREGHGVIQRNQLILAFKEHCTDHEEINVNTILNSIDTDGSGKIDFTQFLVAASNQQRMLNEKKLDQAFAYFDSDHSGFITLAELEPFLEQCHETTASIRKVFEKADMDHDGVISKKQFKQLLLEHT